MTVTDVQNACYRDLQSLGIPVMHADDIRDMSEERCVIRTNQLRKGSHWSEGGVEIIVACPDVRGQVTARLGELEQMLKSLMDATDAREWNGEYYHYEFLSGAIEKDKDMECHYVHYTYNFKTLY